MSPAKKKAAERGKKAPVEVNVIDVGTAIVTTPGDRTKELTGVVTGAPPPVRSPKVAEVQAAARLEYLPRIRFLCDMIDGALTRDVVMLSPRGARRVISVTPTFAERLEAMKELGKISQLHAAPIEPTGRDGNSAAFVSRALNALALIAGGMATSSGTQVELAVGGET